MRDETPGLDPSSTLSPSAAAADALAAQLTGEMAELWRKGERRLTEEFLSRHPELCDEPEAAVQLIYEEICLRQEDGEDSAESDVLARFPLWRDKLEVVLDCQRLLQPDQMLPRFPEVGESLGDFRFLAELGRGAVGRVFLGVQPSLGDRPVALKLTPCDGREHLTLARLQHTHIMPLYAVQDYPTRNLRLLCMPYFGGASLARLLGIMKEQRPDQRTGRDFLKALEQTQTRETPTFPGKGPGRQFLARASYIQAVCWMAACLADALHDAHEHGLVHLDIKPSNVMLTADCQPLLLDFHLAHEPIQAGSQAPERLGGTLEFLSPEQRLALEAVRTGTVIPLAVDGRSDVYSLGLVLYEALGGKASVVVGPPASLRQSNPNISVGLADLVGKCLAVRACDRYPTAANLAADLRQYLSDRPLRGVPNRSLPERWSKWRRRHPDALALGTMRLVLFLVVLGAGVLAVFQYRHHVHQVEEHHREREKRIHEAEIAHVESTNHLKKQEYGEAESAARRGLRLRTAGLGGDNLEQSLGDDLRRAQRGQAAQKLHRLADHIRFLYGAETLSPETLRTLAADCRKDWAERDQLRDHAGMELAPEIERRLQTDLLDLGLIWADLQVRLASSAELAQVQQDSLGVLADVEHLFGPNPVLDHQRQVLARALGQTELAEAAGRRARESKPQTAWEHYALGRFAFRSGRLLDAAAAFERAIDLEPQDFWPHFYAGICAYRLQQYETALHAFDVAVALGEQTPECWFNRGLANAALDRPTRAMYDFDRALQLNPGLAAAALGRGALHYQARRYPEAVANFHQALKTGADPATVHFQLALVHQAQQNRTAALLSLEQALRHNPQHGQARELLDRMQRARNR
jgi:eukaryotic-like serine/threonine-protein kinase